MSMHSHGRHVAWRVVDALLGLALAASAVALWRRSVLEKSEVFDSPAALHACVAVLALAGIGFAFRGARGGTWGRALQRGLIYAASLLLSIAVATRIANGSFIVPSRHIPGPPDFGAMSEANRLYWAVRTAQHAAALQSDTGGHFIPSQWPFPADVELGVVRRSDSVLVIARVSGSANQCQAILIRPGLHSIPDAPVCGPIDPLNRDLLTSVPQRRTYPVARSSGAFGNSWPQYRRDFAKSGGIGTDSPISAGWVAPVLAGIRASASVSGELVIIGTHGAGSVEAFSARTGKPAWKIILPNWIHQDAVSDGRTVLVGFGDNLRSFKTQAPGGLTAIDAASGRVRWTVFEPGSLMTSPVVWDSLAAYVTSAGTLKLRSIETGEELWSAELGGNVNMGPPALRGDTLIVSQDNNRLCSISLAQRRILWCRRIPGMLLLGHSSPSLMGDTIVFSGMTSPGISNFLRNVGRISMRTRVEWLLGFLRPNARNHLQAQRIMLVDLRDGDVLWRGPDLFQTVPVLGHISGAPVVSDSLVVVNLPLPNVVVGIERRTMRTLWQIGDIDSRGPILLAQGRVYFGTGKGAFRVHDANTGRLMCSIPVKRAYDRSGPAMAFGALFFASQQGDIAAIPLAELDSCRSERIRALLATLPTRPMSTPNMRM